LNAELVKRFASEKTSLGEPIQVLQIDKSDGVSHRDEAALQNTRESVIKEYFFGDARRTLSPQIQQVDFDSLVIYKASDCMSPNILGPTCARVLSLPLPRRARVLILA
jgi:polyribonucleotide 5'-hydroxyl-kinase